jgi:hypothetical protein
VEKRKKAIEGRKIRIPGKLDRTMKKQEKITARRVDGKWGMGEI